MRMMELVADEKYVPVDEIEEFSSEKEFLLVVVVKRYASLVLQLLTCSRGLPQSLSDTNW